MFFFFKQKTAYEMRISDWSSDVCSSDLMRLALGRRVVVAQEQAGVGGQIEQGADRPVELARVAPWEVHSRGARFRGKHRIAHERGVTNEIGQTIVGVTGRRDRTRFELADGEGVSIGE